jgi:hypothetical protein
MYELVISIFSLFLQYFSWISELCRHSDSVVYFVFHFIADKNCADTQTLFCNLQSRARTHAILVIGLYELLDPTT